MENFEESQTENQTENLDLVKQIEASDIKLESLESIKKESKAERVAPDYPVIKVQLPREAALKVQTALQILKDRKADTKVDELLSEFLESVTEEYLEIQIEKRTPEDYYFEAAKTIPELREKIIQQAKKALQQRTVPPLIASSDMKKPKKKDKVSASTHVMMEGSEVTQ